MNQHFFKRIDLMRVGNFPSAKYPGSGFHSYNLCKNVSKQSTVFFHPDVPNTNWFKSSENCKRINSKIAFTTKYKSCTTIYGIIRLFKVLKINLHAISVYKHYGPPMLHIHSPIFILLAVYAYWTGCRNLFITYHGSDFHYIKRFTSYKIIAWKIFTHAFYIGSDMKTGIENMHYSSSEVFNGVDDSIFKNRGLTRKNQILAVGSLKREKGFEYLIKGYCKYLREHNDSDYKLVITGGGYLYNSLFMLIKKLGLENNVVLLGNISQSQVITLYNESEVFILSSISEGFPKVVLEAISCGCKVIATDVGSVGRLICNPINSKSPTAISKAIANSIYNYQNNLLPEVSDFTWEKTIEQYSKVYDKFKNS